ncbi:MAG: hypothetical protein A2096_05360 [Spirochaetes bacterium GWF1_41_5]|nr:MAG: hypothetical protein A2096_05360 [Spirochaetes bacterium GWF1_41_5]HBE04328.1 hypothetical protein [Spirochaetia bacterium]
MKKNPKPNIIYILGDDHRAESLGCAGHPVVKTPNIDRLAQDGVQFDNFFCTSPLCTPSRACHYLGQWERMHGINFNSGSSAAETAWDNSFPMLLKKNGYYLGWVGKNHVPAGNGGYESGYFEQVFDYWYGNHNHTGFYPKENPATRGIYSNSGYDTQVEIFEEGVMNFLQPRKNFIQNCSRKLALRDESKPFCLCVTFNLPHAYSTYSMELRPSDDEIYKSMYRDKTKEIPFPKTYIPYAQIENPRIPGSVYNGIQIPSYDYVRDRRTLREWRIREYQVITGMDRFLGRLREKLDSLKLADNTIIVFSTDHGIHHGEHGLGGKNFLYEEDLRIPCVIYDPRLPARCCGKTKKESALVPDLAPTMLDLAGISIPLSMQGKSLLPLLKDEQVSWRNEFFAEALFDGQNYPRSECVRTEEWKYIRYFKRTENPGARGHFRGTLDNYRDCLFNSLHDEQPVFEELYHLKEDPLEETNRSGAAEYSSILNNLREKIITMGKNILPADEPQTLPYKNRY